MIRYTTEPTTPVVEIEVDGEVTDAELKATIQRLQVEIERDGKTRILEVINHFGGIEPRAIWTDLRLGMPLVKKISRVAVVADQAWIRAACHLGRIFTTAELKVFDVAELDQARTWIRRD